MKRASRKHRLKTWPESFEAIRAHKKTFDVRRADRDFREGDTLVLREFVPSERLFGRLRNTGLNGPRLEGIKGADSG